MKDENVVEQILIKVLAVFYMVADKGRILDRDISQYVFDLIAKELKEVGREDLVDKAKKYYFEIKDKKTFKEENHRKERNQERKE